MIHKTFSFLFIAIFFLIFCLSSRTSSTRLSQARRAIMADDDNGDYQDNNNNDYNDASSPAIPPEYVGSPMRPHSSKPDHSATDQHPPPAVIHPPPATPTGCSGMNRQELENCIRRQVNRDLCKNYNIC
ncbi:uncharacterized protein LOC125829886 [Solanum verrucosum]|uniref:uncharacterized protein LOC125829886 n=1 Tax=Solanum verrucosum TaxID=315347 RepID=UPI0020D19DD2|nr:uncharacterized protein LOC125829886 [Solanum verrucosum]